MKVNYQTCPSDLFLFFLLCFVEKPTVYPFALFVLFWVHYLLDTMEDWDQETLEKVIESKKTEYNQNKPTEIVCHILHFGYLDIGCCSRIFSFKGVACSPLPECFFFL